MGLFEIKRSFLFFKSQLKQYETMFDTKYYEVITDILLTS